MEETKQKLAEAIKLHKIDGQPIFFGSRAAGDFAVITDLKKFEEKFGPIREFFGQEHPGVVTEGRKY